MKKLMAANWKMHKSQNETLEFLKDVATIASALPDDREMAIFPPFTALHLFSNLPAQCFVGGQNCHSEKEGAFTGEISAMMLKDAGCTHVLAGHSERRALFHENDDFIGEKTSAALAAGLHVVFCIGETLEEREAGNLATVLERQLKALPQSVKGISAMLSVAYEPVWAIGTGKVAGPAEIMEAHAFIRKNLTATYGTEGNQIRILYGGSVKPDNANEILGLANVNGVLVGGASLQSKSFSQIVLA